MLAQAAIPLSVSCHVFTDGTDEATASLLPQHPIAGSDLARWSDIVDVVTFEHELLDRDIVRAIEATSLPVRPSAAVMHLSDKAHQRRALHGFGLPVPAFVIAHTTRDITAFGDEHGWPIVVKLATGGYDGRGVWIIDAPAALRELPVDGRPLVIEPCLPLERELAIQIARRPGGQTAVYPLVETVQRDGMCREVIAPAPSGAALADDARQLAIDVAKAIDLAGLLAIELFVVNGTLLINELAPRVHNSGHYTIEGCTTSQFENNLRAVLDWPLGSTALRAPAVVMVNVVGSDLGDPLDRLSAALAIDDVHVHLYAKSWRPGRKLGHVTALANDVETARQQAHRAVHALGGLPMEV
jgi:5-(carboxyamino)imidazole ribonucleotide synthase